MNDKVFLILFAFLAAAGCSTQKMAVQMALPLVQGQYDSIQEEVDPELAEWAIPSSLKVLEGLLKSDETNTDILRSLAEGFCGYAFSFVEETDPVRASGLYLRGRNYALRALSESFGVPGLSGLVLGELKQALARVEKEQISSLFWAGQCWGGWLMLSMDDPEAFADISKVEQVMVRALELDETYHYAGPHLFLGVFYGGRSRLLGGNAEKARFHFERSLELTENRYLLAHFLYAKTYAVQNQDRELFDRLLDTVSQTPSEVLSKQRLANEVAKLKAENLSRRADELF
ncbi:MAG: TRAP transporter TatT component family protein [Nitrospinaceae bacterium]